MYARETWAAIDFDKLKRNLRFFEKKTNKEVFCVIKGDAYGHGDAAIARELVALGVSVLCVSSLDEATYLVDQGITCDILIFYYVQPQEIRKYHHDCFIYTVPNLQWFNEVERMNLNLRVHIEMNTGLNRMGLKTADEVVEVLNGHQRVEGIYTHYSSSDEDPSYSYQQLRRFNDILATLDYPFQWIHAANTHAALSLHEETTNAIRLGAGLYGFDLFNNEVEPILSLYTKIVHVDALNPGDSVGYNRTFLAGEPAFFATIPLGSADGFAINHQGSTVYSQGKYYEIIGKICMDETMLLVDKDTRIGDIVEIYGDHMTLFAAADYAETTPMELVFTLRNRIRKEYYRNQQRVAILDRRNQ